MPFKGLRSRPGTSSSSSKRHTVIDSLDRDPQLSSDGGHRKTDSLKRLSLSFSPSRDNTFDIFLSDEPNQFYPRRNSKTDRPATSAAVTASRAIPEETTITPQISVDQPTPTEAEHGDLTIRPERFSLLKYRHASDPQLATRFKQEASDTSEVPPPPTIITTAPTGHIDAEAEKKPKDKLLPKAFSSFRRSTLIRNYSADRASKIELNRNSRILVSSTPNLGHEQVDGGRDSKGSLPGVQSPPAYGDENGSALAIPISRLSDSSRSEGSSGSHKVYAQTTTTHVISTTTTFFKLKRKKKKKKDKGPLFPLPERLPQPGSSRNSYSRNGEEQSIGRKSISPSRKSAQAVRFDTSRSFRDSAQPSPAHSMTALTNAPLGSPGPAIDRVLTNYSAHSGTSTPSASLFPPRPGMRGRSSTLGSLGRSSEKLPEGLTPGTASGRNSTSTSGRKSFGDILSLSHRLRQNSGPSRHNGAGSPSTPASKSNSLQIARESEPDFIYPEREESDTPASYLEKLEAAVPRGAMATILCKSPDDFSRTCLRKYMRGFSYFGESIDMSIRKMLMEVILPKETQQIDRLLAGFADRYHECNPGIFINTDEANFIAFSILLLQSDNHNKNNKRKMTKQDYVKNTQNGKVSVSDDILECFYDNISYTPFIHFEDEIAVNSHRFATPKPKKGLIRSKSTENLRGPVDPYALILDNKLDVLRPSLKDVIETDDTYGSADTVSALSSKENHKAFLHSALLQIVSARSRPDAFMTQATTSNPAEAQAGLVSIKVAKVGLLWRKSAKKKKAKSPWQEWGAIMTDSKLYFFKDVGWVKKLMSQYENHSRLTSKSGPLLFKPPVTSFDPDAWMDMDDAVALTDSSYKRHKYAFTFIKHGGLEEVFLANSEADMNDWISKLNYGATFRTAGVRMRGLLGTNYEGRRLLRQDSEVSSTPSETPQSDFSPPPSTKQNPQMAWEIMFYRRQLVSERISSFDDHVAVAQKELENLLRNSRHLLIQLPIQQKTREAIVFSAGRMNAKLKWTRKEIWRAKIHRDILIKDLEVEATTAFPAPPSIKTSLAPASTKATPTKSHQSSITRQDTDKSTTTKASTVISPTSTRRPSQSILEQIRTDLSVSPELSNGRRRSAGSIHLASPASPTVGEHNRNIHLTSPASPTVGEHNRTLNHGLEAHSLRTQPSTVSSRKSHVGDGVSSKNDATEEDADLRNAVIVTPEPSITKDDSQSERDPTSPNLNAHGTLKNRATSVRRSLQRTLRDSHHVHKPSHHRSKKSKESSSSLAVPEDSSRPLSPEKDELKRDPTGRFILHGKKASVITMSPEWQEISPEELIKLREQSVAEFGTKNAKEHAGEAVDQPQPRRIDGDSDSDSVQSAVTGQAETFHSANSSQRPSVDSQFAKPGTESEESEEDDNSDDDNHDHDDDDDSIDPRQPEKRKHLQP